jgi:ariadne-1
MDTENQKARQELQLYSFYFERYVNNDVAIQSIQKIIKALKEEQKDIAINLALSLTQLEFLLEACLTLRSAKRILKWSYAYGFYLKNDLQRNVYEIILEKMDMHSSTLHVLMEKKYHEAKANIGDFTNFKQQVLSTTYLCKSVTSYRLE